MEGAKDDDLLSEKGGRGWPHLVAMDAEGEVVGGVQDRSVEGFRAAMAQAVEFTTLRAKKDRTPAEDLRFLSAELRLGKVKNADARERANALKGLDDAGKKALDAFLLGLDIRDVRETIKSPAPEPRIAAGKKFAEMWAAGREPALDDDVYPDFFALMLDHAEAVRDPALFEKALGKIREKFGDKPFAANFFKRQEARLEKLKAAPAPEAPKEEGK